MEKKAIPDTIGVSMDTRENLRKASQTLTAIEIPGYELIREIGRGNFGTVWQAERKKTGQRVAIKIVDNETDINWTYFRRELDFLRELEEHPNTLTILDAQLESDPPYIVMPLADGGSLEESVRREPPNLAHIESWLWQMAEALIFIHRKGIIHCDFKPSNVLLSSDKHVRIADLGQARRTGHGVALGTIGFMAPEQSSGKANPSVSWDVYGFGATAYWLLTGKIPRSAETPPSSLEEYAESLQNQPLVSVRRLNPAVDQDLACIVESCLQLDPRQRTASLDAVYGDLQRRRKNEPLHCRRPWRLGYLIGVALKRRTVQAGIVAAILALLAGLYGWHERNYNRYLTQLTTGIHAHESGRLEEAYLHWLEALHYRPDDRSLWERFEFMPVQQIYPHHSKVTDLELADGGNILISSSTDGQVNLWSTDTGELVRTLQHPTYVAKLAVSPQSKWLATASWDGKARIYNLSNGALTWELGQPNEDLPVAVTNIIFSSDGKYLVSADLEGVLKVWESDTGKEKPVEALPRANNVRQVLAVHPTKPLLAALDDSNEIRMWNLETGKPLDFRFRTPEEINDLEFSPNGKYLISGSDDSKASVWDVEKGVKVQDLTNESRVNKVLALPDDFFVTGCEDGIVSVWRLHAEDPVHQLYHRRPVRSLATNHDASLLAVGTGESEHLWSDTEANGTVRVWDIQDGYEVGGPWPHDGPVEAVAFQSRRNLIYSASGSARQSTAFHPGAVRAWHYVLPELVTQLKDPQGNAEKPVTEFRLPNGVVVSHGDNVVINSHAVDGDSQLLATASQDRTVRFWSTANGTEAKAPLLLDGPAKAVAFSPRGDQLATAASSSDSDSLVQLWELETSYPITPKLSCPGTVRALEWSHDGSSLIAYSDRGKYRWTLRNGKDEASWDDYVHHRLRVELDQRGSVVPTPDLSASVMTQTDR